MTHRKISVSLLALTAALSLSACAGNAESAPTPTPPTASTNTSEEARPTDPSQCKDPAYASSHEDFCFSGAGDPFSGPATDPATFPSGVEVKVVAVEVGAAGATHPGKPGEDTLVTVTTEIKNAGTDVFAFPQAKMYVSESLHYGANRYEATEWTARSGGRTDLPAQLVPGTSATMVSEFTVAASGLEKLAFAFSPNSELMPVYTFADAQALIK